MRDKGFCSGVKQRIKQGKLGERVLKEGKAGERGEQSTIRGGEARVEERKKKSKQDKGLGSGEKTGTKQSKAE